MAHKEKIAKPYSYYDSPTGEDVFKKLWVALKTTSLYAFGAGTADVMLYSKPQGYLKTLGRYAFIGLPLLGVTTAFVVTSNVGASLRKKDDKLNWLAGGMAAGSVFGVWTKKPMVGINMALGLGFIMVMKKYCDERGYVLIPEHYTRPDGGLWTVNTDWSLTKERARNWTTGQQ